MSDLLDMSNREDNIDKRFDGLSSKLEEALCLWFGTEVVLIEEGMMIRCVGETGGVHNYELHFSVKAK